jgi:hypothetical protein
MAGAPVRPVPAIYATRVLAWMAGTSAAMTAWASAGYTRRLLCNTPSRSSAAISASV